MNTTRPQTLTSPIVDIGGLVSCGAIAGLTAGLGFILANMWFATASGKPPLAPFLAISTVYHASAMPQATLKTSSPASYCTRHCPSGSASDSPSPSECCPGCGAQPPS
ncbi:MAG TPA: hypothetical protein VJ914_28505 [Pseudonocardiaceae bacterium]|nr:hypothetical protein [Pseudonocardiaceae bacterium]